jgi:uracil-DNA glycosylase
LKLEIELKIQESWLAALSQEFKKEYFFKLKNTLIEEEKTYQVFPPDSAIFTAYNTTPLNKVKVVVIGQDPYHGVGQANGMCFSVNDDIKHPPSLQNIFKEITDNFKSPYPKKGNLMPWASQGVFLLNATLTVRSGEANSHKDIGWQAFTDATIKAISENREGVIFLLWGGFARKKAKLIDTEKHIILESGHPSPLSANRGYWFGNKHFLKVNQLLRERGQSEINWVLD